MVIIIGIVCENNYKRSFIMVYYEKSEWYSVINILLLFPHHFKKGFAYILFGKSEKPRIWQ